MRDALRSIFGSALDFVDRESPDPKATDRRSAVYIGIAIGILVVAALLLAALTTGII